MKRAALLLSIKPAHVEAIVAGDKVSELRRKRPMVPTPITAFLYSTAPVSSVVAMCEVYESTTALLEALWLHVRETGHVTKDEFESYYSGLSVGTALSLRCVTPWTRHVRLNELTAVLGNSPPPQSFRYLDSAQVDELLRYASAPEAPTKSFHF